MKRSRDRKARPAMGLRPKRKDACRYLIAAQQRSLKQRLRFPLETGLSLFDSQRSKDH